MPVATGGGLPLPPLCHGELAAGSHIEELLRAYPWWHERGRLHMATLSKGSGYGWLNAIAH